MKKTLILWLLIVSCLFIPKQKENKENKVNEIKELALATHRAENNIEKVSTRNIEEPRQEEISVESDKIDFKATNISQDGINLIKKYEGLKTNSYRLQGENNYTIGYGHTGSDVKAGQVISEEQAERLLIADLQGIVNHILENYEYLELNQNELDALVSFTYNCGVGSLNQLTANKTRNKEEIAEHITAYTKSGSEVNRNGLQKRRNEEQKMFKGI